jgi:hypothetical protein
MIRPASLRIVTGTEYKGSGAVHFVLRFAVRSGFSLTGPG